MDVPLSPWNIRDGSSKKLPVANNASFFFVSVVFIPDGRYIAALRNWLWIWVSRTHNSLRIGRATQIAYGV